MNSTQTAIPVKMVRWTLIDLPHFTFPEGYGLRGYQSGDERIWTAIHEAADRVNVITPSLFGEQFGSDPSLLAQRQLYLIGSAGQVIGTGTAWCNERFQGRRFGRVHWLAIRPEFQGRGLSKPLLGAICSRLVQLGHDCAYVSTSTARLGAIRLYQQFGFEPLIENEEQAFFWESLNPRSQ